MKKHTWDNPNKMHFESLHKTFNKQTQCLSTGNVWSNTQWSNYIRPSYELECNGFTNEKGHLQNFDLESFSKMGVNSYILNRIKELVDENKGGILYLFKHYNNNQRILDGLVLTDRQYNHIHTWELNQDYRAVDAVYKAREYVTN